MLEQPYLEQPHLNVTDCRSKQSIVKRVANGTGAQLSRCPLWMAFHWSPPPAAASNSRRADLALPSTYFQFNRFFLITCHDFFHSYWILIPLYPLLWWPICTLEAPGLAGLGSTIVFECLPWRAVRAMKRQCFREKWDAVMRPTAPNLNVAGLRSRQRLKNKTWQVRKQVEHVSVWKSHEVPVYFQMIM